MIDILQVDRTQNNSRQRTFRVCDLRNKSRSSLPPERSQICRLPPHFTSSRRPTTFDRTYAKKKKRKEDAQTRQRRILKAYGAVTQHKDIDEDRSLTSIPSLQNWKHREARSRKKKMKKINKSHSTPILNKSLKKLNLTSLRQQSKSPEGRMKLRIRTKNSSSQSSSFRMNNNGTLNIGQFQFSEEGFCHSKGTDRVVADDFLPLSIIGRGSCGVVYKAWYISKWKLVALKCINFRNPEKRDQIVKELCTYREYPNTRNVVDFHGAYFHDDHIWFVLEYFSCGSLQEVIEKYGKIPEHILFSIVRRVAESMDELHSQQLLHRDIKPANILLGKNGDCKITDFGILTNLTENETCSTIVGTHFYMSPERLSGQAYSYSADIWSFGLTLAVLVRGSHPFKTTSTYNEAIFNDTPFIDLILERSQTSPELYDLISSCLSRKASARPTASEILQHEFFSCFSSSQFDCSNFVSLPHESRLQDCSRICWNLIYQHDVQMLSKRQSQNIGSQLGLTQNIVKGLFRSILLERLKSNIYKPKRSRKVRDSRF